MSEESPLEIPSKFRDRLSYNEHAHRDGIDFRKNPDVTIEDKYQYFTDMKKQWPFWTSKFGATLLLSLLQNTEKCVSIAYDRLRVIAEKECEKNNKPIHHPDNKLTMSPEVASYIASYEREGAAIYTEKPNLDNEYVTWSLSDYDNPGFQLWYLRLKSLQRYTESYTMTQRIAALSYFTSYKAKDRAYARYLKAKIENPNIPVVTQPIFRVVTLGGGPAFELLAIRDFLRQECPNTLFEGVSLDVDPIWSAYVQAIGFRFALWDCQAPRITPLTDDEIDQDDVSPSDQQQQEQQQQQQSENAQPTPQPPQTNESTNHDDNNKDSEPKPLPTASENPLPPPTTTTENLQKTQEPFKYSLPASLRTLYDESLFSEENPFIIDMCVISYAFLMYMSAPHQQNQFWKLLSDWSPHGVSIASTGIPTTSSTTSSPTSHTNDVTSSSSAAAVPDVASPDSSIAPADETNGSSVSNPPDCTVYTPPSPIRLNSICILERAPRISTIHTVPARQSLLRNRVFTRCLVQPHDDRQLFIYKASCPWSDPNSRHRHSYNRSQQPTGSGDAAAAAAAPSASSPTTYTVEAPDLIRHASDVFVSSISSRIVFPNVPYRDINLNHKPQRRFSQNNNRHYNNNNNNNYNNNNNNGGRRHYTPQSNDSRNRSRDYHHHNDNNNNNRYSSSGNSYHNNNNNYHNNNNNNNYNNNNNNNYNNHNNNGYHNNNRNNGDGNYRNNSYGRSNDRNSSYQSQNRHHNHYHNDRNNTGPTGDHTSTNRGRGFRNQN